MQLHALQPEYLLNEYRIIKLLGEGGFGLTYLAFDTNLDKKVAIKEYMPSEHSIREKNSNIIAKNEASKKVYDWGLNAFINEAKTLAKFEVSNIVRVHRFFKDNGTAYIVMEYCEGGCLIDQISNKVPMSESKLIKIIAPLVKGLKIVHSGGILHRDIKPENIMFRQDGTPVLIDFGAARQAIGDKNPNITTIVTPGYAPIEQYSSEGGVGPWSDIYSLAAVAYLCLTGERPPDVNKRLYDDRVTKLAANVDASPFLHSIDAGLELHAEDRPQDLLEWSNRWIEKLPTSDKANLNKAANFDVSSSNPTVVNTDEITANNTRTHILIKAVVILGIVISSIFYFLHINENNENLENLKKTIAKPLNNTHKTQEGAIDNIGVSQQKVLAVLPFFNNTPNNDTDYLGFALANQVISNLMYLEKYTVRPAGSIRKYAKQFFDPIKTGQDLKVDYVISGNYLKENNIIRLNVELIKIDSNEIIWREVIEVEYSNTFALQDLVASKVAKKLSANFITINNNQNYKDTPNSSLAYEYYLRALSYPRTDNGHHLAVEMLKKSIGIEPSYAPSHVELGIRLNYISAYGFGKNKGINNAEKHLLTALKLNNASLEALSALSQMYTEKGEALKAVETINKILLIDPNNAEAYFSLSYLYRYTGMLEESLHIAERAFAIDKTTFKSTGVNYYNAGKSKQALDIFMHGDSPFHIFWQGMSYKQLGQNKNALEKFNQLIEIDAGQFFTLVSQIAIAQITNDAKTGLKLLQKIEKLNPLDGEPIYYWGSFYVAFGDKKNGLRLIKNAIDMGYYNVPFMQTDKNLETVRNDPEFIEVIAFAEQKHLAFKNAITEMLLE